MKKIIIVDDEKMVVESISKLVRWEKVNTELIATCLNAFDALDIIENEKPDIVITDIKMPVMDGLELIRKAREINPELEFIVLSGYEEFELAKRAMKEGVKFYLLKPCSEDDIIEAVSASLKEINNRDANKMNLLNGEKIQTELIRQMILMNIQGEDNIFCKDDNLPPQLGKNRLIWIVISGLSFDTGSKEIYDFMKGMESGKQKFIPLIVRINNEINAFFINDNPELSLKLTDYQKAVREWSGNMAADLSVNHSVVISGLESCLIQKEGNYEDFSYSVGGEWIYKQKSKNHLKKDIFKEMERMEKSFYEESIDNIEVIVQDIMKNNSKDKVISVLSNFFLRHLLLGDIDYETMATLIDGFFHDYNSEKTMNATIDLLGKMIRQKGNKDAIDTIITYIDKHLGDEGLTLRRISKEVVFLSEDYVGKKFQLRTGQKFSVYLNQRRVERAKILLRTDKNERNEAIAFLVGYGNNPEYFCKIFKKVTGHTPKEYRKMYED